MSTPTLMSLPISILGLLVCLAIAFQSLGLSQGLTVGDRQLRESERQRGHAVIEFSGDDTNSYYEVAPVYFWMAILFALGTIAAGFLARGFGNAFVQHTFVIASNFAVLLLLRNLLTSKYLVDDSFYEAPRNYFLQTTIGLDWLLVGLSASIVLLQAVSLRSFFKDRKIQ